MNADDPFRAILDGTYAAMADDPVACSKCGGPYHPGITAPLQSFPGTEGLFCYRCISSLHHTSVDERLSAHMEAGKTAALVGKDALPQDFAFDWKIAERAKLTPQLRYNILHRDKFRCKACGAMPETGALLQIDHIKPIACGGLTEWNNLQTLCATCNLGKGARWDGEGT